MDKYLISYDLHAPRKDYENLWHLLNSFRDAIHIQDSVWLIKSPKSSKDISNVLSKIFDSDDSFLICKIESNLSGAIEDEAALKVKKLYQD
ncbi:MULTISPECIES: hypothetical protein [Staphylococcus]|uniref:hypothetical protein n=1 Tax=Staphylococcus TaxID=1279 RepID=UPI0011A5D4FA|nr:MULTISPECIES: hypothetical protein [Staphylococcus]MCI2788480.1 hypothetical protein [Staphylococcus warneri]QSF50960.1 hypothetical protein JX000_08120 [Staphylococcus sp. SB1-57]